jgi:hypothetical protein
VTRLEAESYRTLPRPDLLLNRARAITERYLVPGGIRSVPLSDSVQERILVCCDSELVGPGLFIDAQVQVCRTTNLLSTSLQDWSPVTTDCTQLARAGRHVFSTENSIFRYHLAGSSRTYVLFSYIYGTLL